MPSSPPSLSSPTTPTSGSSPTTRPLPSSSFFNTLRELGCHQRNIHGSGSPTKSFAHMFCYTLSYIPMFIALGLMLGICGPYFYFFIYDYCYLVLYMSGHPYFLLYATSLAIFTVGGMLVAYFRSIFTNPGFVDTEVWQHPPRVLCLDGVVRESRLNSPNQNIVVAKFQGFTPRFCEKCKVYKPDRCHHCSECGKCVLNLDHHCPWICNCVGERNHKYFLLFLLYIGITGAHLGSSIVLAHWMYVGKVSLTASQGIAHFLISLCAGVFSFVMGLFGIFHIFLIASEETTIERNIARLTGKIPPQQKISWVTRCFAICTMKSFRQMIQPVMGDASPFWQWFLPCFSPKYHYSGSTVPGDKNAQIMRRVLGNDDDDEEQQHEMIVTRNKNNTTSMVV